MKVAIADYGAGNLRSLASALVRAGVEPVVTVETTAITAENAKQLMGK